MAFIFGSNFLFAVAHDFRQRDGSVQHVVIMCTSENQAVIVDRMICDVEMNNRIIAFPFYEVQGLKLTTGRGFIASYCAGNFYNSDDESESEGER